MCGVNQSKKIFIFSFADTFTSLLAGTIIFSILGHLAYTLDQPVDQVLGIFIITNATTIAIITTRRQPAYRYKQTLQHNIYITINVTTTTIITINVKTTTISNIITKILPRWSNLVQVLLLSATQKFSPSLISPRRYFVLEHLVRNSKSKVDLVLIES